MANKKKTSPSKTILVSLLALVLGVAIGFVVATTFVTSNLEFYLNGKANMGIGLGSTYKESGVVCNFRGTDYTDDVVISYYNEENIKVSSIETDEVTTFYVEYKIDTGKITSSLLRVVNIVEMEDLEINFMMLGNKYAGDAIYIKAGDVDILVDAGSRQSSAEAITDYLTDEKSDLHSYVSDNKLEYVIATHADQDHIAGFVGTKEIPGVLEAFEIETLIQFPKSDKTSNLYKDYCDLVDELEKNGTNVYTALECYNNENGASRVIELAVGIELEILYNYYYENKTSDENNYSVCFMLRRGEEQFLFTGDLEEKGEEYLVEYNDLSEVYLYKMGHHGSKTSSTQTLLSVIKPKVVVATCCAFTDEYSDNPDNIFPTKIAIDNLVNVGSVEHFYVPTMVSDNKEGYVPANGNIVVYADFSGTGVRCSHSNEDFYNFDVFKQYRTWTK